MSLALGQGTETFTPKSVSLATGLLVPNAAAKVPCRFLASVGNGLAISATFLPDRRAAPGLATLVARVFWSDDFVETLRLCTIWLEPIVPFEFDCAIGPDTIGIALATYNPDIFLFRKQIESIRRQTYGDWVCAISDDCSGPAQLSGMQAVIDTDSRFALAFSANNSGVYRNFERAIALLPERCGWVACSDQDDEWAPEKLEVLIGEAKRTQSPAVFSDMEIYSSTGKRLADTFWTYRRLETKNPTAIAIANTVTGMAMLMRSSVLSTALPFPALPGMAYHDRWLTLAALAQGELHYVGKPLVRYIQHPGNHTGVLKRPAGILVLTLRFVKCLAECGVALLRPSRRHALPAQLERCAHWSSIERLSLSLQIEALQQRLAARILAARSIGAFPETVVASNLSAF